MNAGSVLQDLRKSGLIEILDTNPKHVPTSKYLHARLLEAMAKLADQNGGRECSVTYVQCANMIGIDKRLEQSKRVELIEKIINPLIEFGIIELVSKQHSCRFRFASIHVFKAVGNDILCKKICFQNVVPPFTKR